MQTAGVAALPGLVIAAIAIGAAAGLAPQIGSAISAVGFLVLMANATMQAQGVLSMLPVAVIFAAAMSGWWIAWGRTEAAASAALTCALALGCLTGNTFLAAGVTAGVASFWLGPASAAAATGMGALLPVWPRSRFQPEACWGSVTLPQRWETHSFGLPLCW